MNSRIASTNRKFPAATAVSPMRSVLLGTNSNSRCRIRESSSIGSRSTSARSLPIGASKMNWGAPPSDRVGRFGLVRSPAGVRSDIGPRIVSHGRSSDAIAGALFLWKRSNAGDDVHRDLERLMRLEKRLELPHELVAPLNFEAGWSGRGLGSLFRISVQFRCRLTKFTTIAVAIPSDCVWTIAFSMGAARKCRLRRTRIRSGTGSSPVALRRLNPVVMPRFLVAAETAGDRTSCQTCGWPGATVRRLLRDNRIAQSPDTDPRPRPPALPLRGVSVPRSPRPAPTLYRRPRPARHSSPWKKRPAVHSSTRGRRVRVRFRGGALFPRAGGANRCAIPPAIYRGEGDNTPSPHPSPVGAPRRRALFGLSPRAHRRKASEPFRSDPSE